MMAVPRRVVKRIVQNVQKYPRRERACEGDYFTIRTVGWASASHQTTNWLAGVAVDVVMP